MRGTGTGIVSHRSTACMRTGLYALSPLDFSASIRDGLVCDLGFIREVTVGAGVKRGFGCPR